MRLVLVILGLAVASDPAFAGCVEGRWADNRRASIRPPIVVSITQGTVAIEGLCPPVPVRLRGKVARTIARATWPSCGDMAGPLRLRAVIGPACIRMRAVVRRPSARKPVFGFLGRRVAVCGNGTLEFGESCDDGNQGSGDCCSSTCQRETDCRDGCRTNADCAAGAYCVKQVGSCGADGRCMERPDLCPRDYVPVCGCDGVTYGNDCDAAAAGASVAHTGPCRGDVCGTIAGIGCPKGDFCDYDPDECQTADVAGTCRPIPDGCTLQYDPVCGCDGMTYGNDCERQAKQAQKAHDGACAK